MDEEAGYDQYEYKDDFSIDYDIKEVSDVERFDDEDVDIVSDKDEVNN